MEAVDLAVQFGGVFVGAFLAIGLENYRQARHTRRWVREHLTQLAGWLRPAVDDTDLTPSMAKLYAALDQWQSGDPAGRLDDEAWNTLASRFNTMPLDFGHLLRTDAVVSLPNELGPVIHRVEGGMRNIDNAMSSVRSIHERDILPLVYERRVPLQEADARRVQDYRECLDYLAEAWESLRKSVIDMCDRIDRL